jgi:hypothetical protein
MTHDPLCPQFCDGKPPKCRGGDCTLCDECDCFCDLIAKVREDMLAKSLAAVEASLLNRILDLSHCMKDDDCHIWAEAIEVAYSDSMESLRGLQKDQ